MNLADRYLGRVFRMTDGSIPTFLDLRVSRVDPINRVITFRPVPRDYVLEHGTDRITFTAFLTAIREGLLEESETA